MTAALKRWAAEHSQGLSQDTLDEVHAIGDSLASSPLHGRHIGDLGPDIDSILATFFGARRARRASALLAVVAEWAAEAEPEPPADTNEPEPEPPADTNEPEPEPPADTNEPEPDPEPEPEPDPPVNTNEPEPEGEPEPDLPVKTNEPDPEPDPPVNTTIIELAAVVELSAAGESRARGKAVNQREDDRGDHQHSPDHLHLFAEPEAPDEDVSAPPSAETTLIAPQFDIAPAPLPRADLPMERPADNLTAPAFLRSDKVDEEDDVRLYGPRRRSKAIAITLVVLALLGGLGYGVWAFATRDTTSAETTAAPTESPIPDTTAPTAEPDTGTGQPSSIGTPTPEATPTPEPTPQPSHWASTDSILNAGDASIIASTYAVSPAHRAVLTGHGAAVTGVAVSDDGRVLTSGADRRLVDWGADVTIAQPEVLTVPHPLTVLERTKDQRIITGDSTGAITIIDLVTETQPLILQIHDVAVSAVAEVADGRLAVASVDGDVSVFHPDAPDQAVVLTHSVEVTAVAALPDGTIATAAVDGIVRLWRPDIETPDEIMTLDGPVTALVALPDGTLAQASVNGQLQILDPDPDASPLHELDGHTGAVRALHPMTLADGTAVVVSGGDDTTVAVWDLASGARIRVFEGHGDLISDIGSLPDGRIVSTSGDGTGRVWDPTYPIGHQVFPTHEWNVSALHVWDNDQFVSGGADGRVVLASTVDQSVPTLITTHDAPVVQVDVLESGEIVSLDALNRLRITPSDGSPTDATELTIATGAATFEVRPTLGIVSGHADGTVRFHNLTEETGAITAHGTGVNDVAILADGRIVSVGEDKTARVIDPDNPGVVPVFDLHTSPIDVVIQLPDGRVASAGSDAIYVWSPDTMAEGHVRLNGQRSRALSLIGLGNDQIISAGTDGRVRLWDLSEPDAEPRTLVNIPGIINPYVVEADNGSFVAAAARGYVVFALPEFG